MLYIEAEGKEDMLEEFVDWCKKGPSGAKVDNIKIQHAPLKNFKEFKIE